MDMLGYADRPIDNVKNDSLDMTQYVYGLSATPNRSDRLDDIIFMLLGPMRHKYTAREQGD